MRYRTALILSFFALAPAGPVADAAASTSSGGVLASSPATRARIHRSAIATWFGPGFYGRKTACGQTLTPMVIGVANRTLPCGTLVKVTYGAHTLVVPVLDRGPYSHLGADWDLTFGAAAALVVSETVRIATRVVGSTPNVPTLGEPPEAVAAMVAGGAVAG